MPSLRLTINPIRCLGNGVCQELLPELLEPDEWGFPIISAPLSGGDRLSASVPPDLVVHAKRAVAACPKLALELSKREGSREGSAR